MLAAMRAVSVTTVLRTPLGPARLGLRRALDDRGLPRLLSTLDGLGGTQVLAGAPGGTGIAGNLRRGGDGRGHRRGAVRLRRRHVRMLGLTRGGLGLLNGVLTPASHAAHRRHGLRLRRVSGDRSGGSAGCARSCPSACLRCRRRCRRHGPLWMVLLLRRERNVGESRWARSGDGAGGGAILSAVSVKVAT